MRITRSIAIALLVSLAPMASTAPVQAQGAAEDPITAMARTRFKEGVEFYDKGAYEQARASFLQAYALKKHPSVLLNLAWSCVKSGHALEADRYFKQFLAEGKDITEKQRADATEGLAQAHAKLGRIDVVAGAGTEVTIDGDKVGNAPLAEPVVVEAGAHTVKFRATDGTTDTQSITVLGNEKAVARSKMMAALPAPAAPAAPPTTPAPSAETTGTPAAATPKPTSAHAEAGATAAATVVVEPAGAESKTSVFAPPKNVVPVILLGSVAVLGYVGAAAAAVFKGQAQDKADQLATQIKQAGGKCPPSPGAQTMVFGPSCSAWDTDNSQVNDDALGGNILLGVGVAATAGAIVYWLLADKRDDAHPAAKAVLTPIVGPTVSGMSLSGQF
jgi:Tfp pilus assembly protein PilF